ncbi:DUF559 domain-containing protein [Desulfovibrio litoralis]|uniref:DUF559 domain-containing protein n=1 Tax=Desulfovibrio litoralis DSM 11393 TaxID=1121455 RepID=A0A1M7TP26_9BACT|nr:DUF559 domain-containing protein [Desulfovibrio litoralis]SHN72440.1 Protein of unknown function [Desulfovibrio litoralis DSM 11393]
MSLELILSAFLAVAVLFIIILLLKRTPPTAIQNNDSRMPENSKYISCDTKNTQSTSCEEISFEEKYKTGDLGCDGQACQSKEPCLEAERWLCRDVISKVVPKGYFIGQFELKNLLPELEKKKNRRIDFAIETKDGRRIAVELDGYDAHTKSLSRRDFDDQLLRQNALVRAGWVIVRFSFDQLRNNAEECCKMLHSLMYPEHTWFNKTPVLKGVCLNPDCKDEVYRLRNKEGGFFWKCKKCTKTYNHDRVEPITRLSEIQNKTSS